MGTSHVLRGLERPYPVHSFAGLPLPCRRSLCYCWYDPPRLERCQARCVEIRWRLSTGGQWQLLGGCWGDSRCPVHNSPFPATFWFFQLLLLLFSPPSSPSLSFLSLFLQPLATLSAFLASLGPPRPFHLPIMAPGPSLALRPRDWVWGASQPGLGALSGRQWCRRPFQPLQLRPSCRA